jgi:hypothetical protein
MKNYLLFNFYGLRFKVPLATSWEELNPLDIALANEIIHLRILPFVQRKLMFLLTKANSKKRVNFFFTLLFFPLTRWMFDSTSSAELIATLSEVVDAFIIQEKGLVNYLPQFEVPMKLLVDGKKKARLVRFVGPKNGFELLTFERYIEAECAYLQYLETGKMADLQDLFLALYTANGEFDIMQVRLGYLLECLSYFSRCRAKMIEANKDLFIPSEGTEKKIVNAGLKAKRSWYETIHLMARENIDAYKSIEGETVHRVMFNLNEKKKLAEQRQSELDKQRSKA